MSLDRPGGVQNVSNGFFGSWEVLDAFVDPTGDNTKIPFGQVREGSLNVTRELFEWKTNQLPAQTAATVTTSINMAFTGQNEELTAGILHMQIGDAGIDDTSGVAYVGDVAANPYFSFRGQRNRGPNNTGKMTFMMYKAQAGADFEMGSEEAGVVSTPLTINALSDPANEYASGGTGRIGWISIEG